MKGYMETILLCKILLRLFSITDDKVVFNNMYFMDEELKELIKRLKQLSE